MQGNTKLSEKVNTRNSKNMEQETQENKNKKVPNTPKMKDAFSIKPLLLCHDDIKAWMALNYLHFKGVKSEVMVLGPNGCGESLPLLT